MAANQKPQKKSIFLSLYKGDKERASENSQRTEEWARSIQKDVKRQQRRSRRLRFMLMGG